MRRVVGHMHGACAKKLLAYMVTLVVLLSISSVGDANDAGVSQETEGRLLTIAVVDFSNLSGEALIDIQAAANEILSTVLADSGRFQVLERNKLKSIVTEQGFTPSGLVDSSTHAVAVGRMIGANYLITGSIIKFGVDTVNFQGYGITTTNTTARMSVVVKVLDVTTGKIVIAKTYDELEPTLSTSTFDVKKAGLDRDLLRRALTRAVGDLIRIIEPQSSVPRVSIRVPIMSSPDGADIEIDGLYVGNTPLELDLPEGIHEIVISKPGYEPWSKRVNVYSGLRIMATLVEKRYARTDSSTQKEK